MQPALSVETRWGGRTLDVRLTKQDAVALAHGDEAQLRSAQATLDRPALTAAGRLLGDALALEPGETLEVRRGPLTARYRLVTRPPQAPRGTEPDVTLFKVAALTFLFAVSVAAMCQVTFLGRGGEGDPLSSSPASFQKWLVKADPPKPRALPRLAQAQRLAVTPTAAPKPRDAAPRPADKRRADRARVAGLLDGLFGGDARDSVFTAHGLGVGINQALEGLHGDNAALAGDGLAGLGARGGPSGGEPGPSLSLGQLGARRGPPQPGGFAVPGGRHVSVTPCGAACTETLGDGLPRDVVAKVIARHFSEVKFCYEQELQKTQTLAGKVAVLFVIDGTGNVQDARVAESTMDNANVEACIAARVRRWKFPEPRGGGVVSVTYPWVFKPAGSEE